MIGWLAGFVAVIALVGFFAALVVFFIAFLRLMAKTSWLKTLLLTLVAAAFVLVLARSLNLVMPTGLLQAHVDLPWPLR